MMTVRELPVLVMTSWRGLKNELGVRLVARNTGKLIYDTTHLVNAEPPLRLSLDRASGKMELTGFNIKLIVTPVVE